MFVNYSKKLGLKLTEKTIKSRINNLFKLDLNFFASRNYLRRKNYEITKVRRFNFRCHYSKDAQKYFFLILEVGDNVKADEVIAEVETDKVNV